MKTIYIQEWRQYSKNQVLEKIDNDNKTFEKLLKYAIIDNENDKYRFNYVGVIIINDFVINCYPKYIPEDVKPHDDFKQVLKVIKKYKNLYENTDYQNEELEDVSYSQLSMMIFFLEDYYEHGVYSNSKKILQINGNGEIDWNRTINYTMPLIKDNEPYYMELYTKYNIDDLYDYFRLLHEYIVTTCSAHLEKAGLLELFDLTPIELSDKVEEDFGEKESILNKISKELNVEFNSHKQKLLKAMHTFISQKNSFSNENYLTVYGTTTYHVIWEEMCSKILNNKLEKPLDELDINMNPDDNPKDRLIDVIKKPKWMLKEGNFRVDTFKPDLITLLDDYFIIFDAKYYDLQFTPKFSGQPGLGDVTKQYLYELAYREFINSHGFNGVKNAFLMPTYCKYAEYKGYVEIEILHDLGLQNIDVFLLPAHEVNRLYLENGKIDIKIDNNNLILEI